MDRQTIQDIRNASQAHDGTRIDSHAAAMIACRQEWERAKQEFAQRIAEIDSFVPWQPTEPAWWIEMQEVRRVISK